MCGEQGRGTQWGGARGGGEGGGVIMDSRCQDLMSTELLQLLNRANDNHLFHVLGDPDRQGGAPKPAAADSPVMCISQPVVEALLLDIAGHPVGLGVVGHQLLLDLGHLYKPAGNSLQRQHICNFMYNFRPS